MIEHRITNPVFKYGFAFEDVLLIPKRSDIVSRSEIDLTSNLGKHEFSVPIISSPMDTVTEASMARAMYHAGGLGVVHRYNTINQQLEIVRQLEAEELVAAAIGVTGEFESRAAALVDCGVEIICIDVAHGHHILTERALKTLKDKYAEGVTIIAGNVATAEAFVDLSSWGADAIRVGIGGGSICSTRTQTGHGVPTFQSVMACGLTDADAKIIADGGIKTSGDIVKCLAAGADFVMLGSMLAGTDESPGERLVSNTGVTRKVYRGMASREAQKDWRGHTSSLEGISTTIPCKGPVGDQLQDVIQNIRSGFSYTGARNIRELQARAEFVIQTAAGQRESSTHILG